jgi:hypothetical protein
VAWLLTTDGAAVEIYPKNGRTSFTLQELQHYVGGYIEAVYMQDGRVLIVNEEGKLHGLAFNYRATAHAANVLVNDHIVGNAVLCTMEEAGGDGSEDEEEEEDNEPA